jgi:hypothetical protein
MNEIETPEFFMDEVYDEYEKKFYTAARHGLNYAKLYHGLDGGYSMEKLKKVLKRIKSDHKEHLHPFIDEEEDFRVDQQLRKILKQRVDQRPKEVAKKGNDDEERVKTAEEYLLEEIEEDEEKELTKELFRLIREKQQKEREEDLQDGEVDEHEELLNDKDLQELRQMYMDETGYHLHDIEDEEEFIKAWI